MLAAARAAAAAGRLFRETPITLVREGTLLEGVVDIAFDSGSEITVIDFKTDRPEGEVLERYERQVRLYAEAFAQATGQAVRAVLMRV